MQELYSHLLLSSVFTIYEKIMKRHLVKINSIKQITPDVLQFVTEKPPNYTFNPGQATEISINKN